ncbi:MAG: sigma-70 family RNA polymerase sigma factor [Bacteroidia bacterium]|nr:sigma-70 family RNA polymerase sigma factor [Bacteroidia bacterium]
MKKVEHTLESLISACREGSSPAQKEIYLRYSRAMYNTAFRIVNDEWEAEDLMQEAFLDAFDNLKSYEGRASFGSWLKRIVINRCLNHLKKRKISFTPAKEEEWEKLPEENPEEDQPDIDISPESVSAAIEKLADGFRVIVSLYLIEGYDHQEIGEILNIQASTSRSQFARGKEKLRKILLKQIQMKTYNGKR